MKHKITIFSDGGSRGNPGPAGVGVVVEGLPEGKLAFGEYIGKTTNNEAEYRALIRGLMKVKESDASIERIDCYADSELMVKQLNGEYKVKDSNLRGFYLDIQGLKSELAVPITFNYIPRAKNAAADELLNDVLDKETGKKKFDAKS